MSEEDNIERDEEFDNEANEDNHLENVIQISGMYKEWFLDYASYVILERAVPAIDDGFKPVQRRIMHSMKDLDDGRYNKVANIVGHTMQYHPHGDASIGDALVQVGQKDLLVDCQWNWGNIYFYSLVFMGSPLKGCLPFVLTKIYHFYWVSASFYQSYSVLLFRYEWGTFRAVVSNA